MSQIKSEVMLEMINPRANGRDPPTNNVRNPDLSVTLDSRIFKIVWGKFDEESIHTAIIILRIIRACGVKNRYKV